MNILKLSFVLIFIGCSSVIAQQTKSEKPKVFLNYLQNPYSDYLFYLLHRQSPKKYNLDSIMDLDDIPTLDYIISLPEMVASANIKSYNDIYKILDLYSYNRERVTENPFPKILAYSDEMPDYDSLLHIVRAGEQHFERFYQYWQAQIQPDENNTIKTWKIQDSLNQPFEKLQEKFGYRFKSDTLDVVCIALHLAGSGNYSPSGIYSSIFKKPDLARFVGHEGTHLLLTKYYGRDWREDKLFNKAEKLALENQLHITTIEEMLCMFLQTALSQECGYTDVNLKVSKYFNDAKMEQKILLEFEKGWNKYLLKTNKKQDIIQFMLTSSINALSNKTDK